MKNANALGAALAIAATLIGTQVGTHANNQAAFSPEVKTLSGLSETFNIVITSPVIGCDDIKDKGVTIGEYCHWPITVEVRPLVLAGNGDANALSYVTLSTTSLTFTGSGDKQTVAVTVDVPATATPGDYQYQIKTFEAVEADGTRGAGYGHGPGSIINVSVAEPPSGPVVTDVTEPVVTISSPAQGAQLAYCLGGTPLSFAFDAVEDGVAGSTVASVAANVNGAGAATTATGLSTLTASATGGGSIGGIGAFTINASATNSFGLTGSASRDVSVSYTLGWLPPLALGKVHNGGSTVPVKFTVRDCQSTFVRDETVNVVIYETSATGAPQRLNGVFGEGASSVRIDDVAGQYIINFPTTKGAKTYRVDVYFQGWADGQAGQWIKQGTTTFTTR